MENYLMINGKRINLTEEQIQTLTGGSNEMVLADKSVGQTFKIGEYEFFVLEQMGDHTAVLMKGLLEDEVKFGNGNNYESSDVDNMCREFGDKIAEILGADNLIEHTVDLTADDGLKCYGSIKRKMSLLTAEQYRKYVYIIDEHKLDKWWWLATAFSTAKHNDTDWVKCVSPSGDIDVSSYNVSNGVRPFLHFVSSIFVS